MQKYENLADLEKCRKMIIYLQRSALIQPRTSHGKSDVSWRYEMHSLEAETDGVPIRAAIHHHAGRTNSGASLRQLACASADCAIVLADSSTLRTDEVQVQGCLMRLASDRINRICYLIQTRII